MQSQVNWLHGCQLIRLRCIQAVTKNLVLQKPSTLSRKPLWFLVEAHSPLTALVLTDLFCPFCISAKANFSAMEHLISHLLYLVKLAISLKLACIGIVWAYGTSGGNTSKSIDEQQIVRLSFIGIYFLQFFWMYLIFNLPCYTCVI